MIYCILLKKELQHIVIVLYIAPISCKLCHSAQSPLPSPEYYSSSSPKVYDLAPLTILSLSPSLPSALPANQIFPLPVPVPISKSDASSIHLIATIPINTPILSRSFFTLYISLPFLQNTHALP